MQGLKSTGGTHSRLGNVEFRSPQDSFFSVFGKLVLVPDLSLDSQNMTLGFPRRDRLKILCTGKGTTSVVPRQVTSIAA